MKERARDFVPAIAGYETVMEGQDMRAVDGGRLSGQIAERTRPCLLLFAHPCLSE